MILGQLRMGARQAKNAPLLKSNPCKNILSEIDDLQLDKLTSKQDYICFSGMWPLGLIGSYNKIMITTDRTSLKTRQCVDRQTMRRGGQLRSSIAGKARQTEDSTIK